jgi:hypothetical protein
LTDSYIEKRDILTTRIYFKDAVRLKERPLDAVLYAANSKIHIPQGLERQQYVIDFVRRKLSRKG